MKPADCASAGARAGSAFAALGALMLFTAACACRGQDPLVPGGSRVIFAQGGRFALGHEDDWREEGPPPVAKNTVELLAALSTSPVKRAGSKRDATRSECCPRSALDLTDGGGPPRSVQTTIECSCTSGGTSRAFRSDDAPARAPRARCGGASRTIGSPPRPARRSTAPSDCGGAGSCMSMPTSHSETSKPGGSAETIRRRMFALATRAPKLAQKAPPRKTRRRQRRKPPPTRETRQAPGQAKQGSRSPAPGTNVFG